MKKLMQGRLLDRLAPGLRVYWTGQRFTFETTARSWTLTPDELAELSRELLLASVTKGE